MTSDEPSLFRPKRLVYLGTPDLAIPPLRALLDAGFDIPLVVSQPDKRRGRGKGLMPSPVKAAAIELGIEVTDRVDDALDVGADLGVVVAFGRILKPHVLVALPMVNIHFSLLPRWRGAAPVERALLAGDAVTGVCLMDIVDELDAGAVYASESVTIDSRDTLDSLRGRLVEMGTSLLVRSLSDGLGTPIPQSGEPVHAKKIDRDELRLDFQQPASVLDRVIRLGGAWVEFRGKRLRLWEATPTDDGPDPGRVVDGVVGTGSGGLRLIEVQPEGKQRMDAASWLNGAQPTAEDRFG